MQVRAHVLVSGLVQGVGFRYFVYDHAVRLGVVGYVRNLYTGNVEIEAEGDRSIIEEFLKEVRIGPRASKVSDLEIKWIAGTGKDNQFEIR